MSARHLPQACNWRGLPAWCLRAADGGRVTVLERGAQVVSWCTEDGVERLYVSPRARLEQGAAIRGGVPVCFPQFAGRGSLPQHGIVRTRDWHCAPSSRDTGHLLFELDDHADTRALWPHRFQLQLEVTLGANRLELALVVRNAGEAAFAFMAALHTYCATGELTRCHLAGLPPGPVFDNFRQMETAFPGGMLPLVQALDQVHADVTTPLHLRVPAADGAGGGALEIRQSGFADVVVWNPGAERARSIADLPEEDWRRFICVEAAQINQPVVLPAGMTWRGQQSLVWQPAAD